MADKHDELLDVLTPQGLPTGSSVSRRQVHAQGLWHRTVHVWCVSRTRGAVICQRRHPDKMTNPNRWDVSSAGHVDAGTTSLDSAVRELEEELGLVLAPEQLELLFTAPAAHVYHQGTYIDNEIVDVYLAEVDVDVADLKLQKEEVIDAQYFRVKEYETRIATQDTDFVLHDYLPKEFFSVLRKRYPEMYTE